MFLKNLAKNKLNVIDDEKKTGQVIKTKEIDKIIRNDNLKDLLDNLKDTSKTFEIKSNIQKQNFEERVNEESKFLQPRKIIKKEDIKVGECKPYFRLTSKTTDSNIIEELKLKEDIKEIDYIEFTLLSSYEIRSMSVVEITHSRLQGDNSLYDLALGPFSDSETGGKIIKARCATCGKNIDFTNPDEDCNGHFGHIELEQPIPNPIHSELIKKYLQLICRNCNHCIYNEEIIHMKGFDRYNGMSRLDKLYKDSENLNNCYHCSSAVPKYKEDKDNEGKYRRVFKKIKDSVYIVSYKEIHDMFKNLSDKDFEVMGFKDKRIHPRNLILEAIPVLPICARLPLFNKGELQHDDLTNKYLDIIKVNDKIRETTNDFAREKYIDSLAFNIKILMDNTKKKCRDKNSNRVFKSIKHRINGKQGRLRQNIQGKRCDFNARTVITAEANGKADEVVIPDVIAKELTYPVNVNKLNIEECRKLLEQGSVKTIIESNGKCIRVDWLMQSGTITLYPSDIIERDDKKFSVEQYEWKNKKQFKLLQGDRVFREGKEIKDIVIRQPRKIELKEGQIIERHLKDGDIVLLNRQPTLWKGSMRAKKVKIRPGKTFRFSLCSTSAFNADFDKLLSKTGDVKSVQSSSHIIIWQNNLMLEVPKDLTTTLIRKLNKGSRLIAEPDGNNVKYEIFFYKRKMKWIISSVIF